MFCAKHFRRQLICFKETHPCLFSPETLKIAVESKGYFTIFKHCPITTAVSKAPPLSLPPRGSYISERNTTWDIYILVVRCLLIGTVCSHEESCTMGIQLWRPSISSRSFAGIALFPSQMFGYQLYSTRNQGLFSLLRKQIKASMPPKMFANDELYGWVNILLSYFSCKLTKIDW